VELTPKLPLFGPRPDESPISARVFGGTAGAKTGALTSECGGDARLAYFRPSGRSDY
jgi:hypothetical protein